MKRCHICGSLQILGLADSDVLKRVSSDCLPMFSATLLLSCLDCGALITDTTPEWHRACAEVYAEYEVYGQSGGVEEKTFSIEGNPTPRSRVLTSLMAASGLALEGAWLDFGCGNGSFLRQVLGRFSGVAGYGIEYNERHRDAVLMIPGARGFGASIDELDLNSFQTISMIHVLEHIENPLPLLETLTSRLAPGGSLLIQVPHIWTNPYVVTVGDHATHFDLPSLKRLIHEAGFDVTWAEEDFIAGELTLLARRPMFSRAEPKREDLEKVSIKTNNSLRHLDLVTSLGAVSNWLTWQRDTNKVLGVFGTSIAGNWAGSCIGFAQDYWVDEDPSRLGRSWLGREIISPSQVGLEDRVVIPLAPIKADKVVKRLRSGVKPINVLSPPLSLMF